MYPPVCHVFRNEPTQLANLQIASLRDRIVAQLIDGILLGMAVSLWLAIASGGRLFSVWVSPVVPVYLLQVSRDWIALKSDWWWGGYFVTVPIPFMTQIKLAYPSPVIWLAYLFYYTYFTGKYGQTPGKMLKGLVVLHKDGALPGFWQAFLRWLGCLISLIAAGFGIWAAFFDSEKRTWHDRWTGTRVWFFLKWDAD